MNQEAWHYVKHLILDKLPSQISVRCLQSDFQPCLLVQPPIGQEPSGDPTGSGSDGHGIQVPGIMPWPTTGAGQLHSQLLSTWVVTAVAPAGVSSMCHAMLGTS
jgi:hypothetical protein